MCLKSRLQLNGNGSIRGSYGTLWRDKLSGKRLDAGFSPHGRLLSLSGGGKTIGYHSHGACGATPTFVRWHDLTAPPAYAQAVQLFRLPEPVIDVWAQSDCRAISLMCKSAQPCRFSLVCQCVMLLCDNSIAWAIGVFRQPAISGAFCQRIECELSNGCKSSDFTFRQPEILFTSTSCTEKSNANGRVN